MTMEISTKFGEEMKQKEFTMQDGVTFINHGSYGVVPRRVQEAQRSVILLTILEEMNNHPDIFFPHNLRLQLDEARKCIANFVHADPEDLVFVQNATTGINTVLKSLKLESGEILLCTDNSYLTVKHTCEALTASSDVKDLITEYLPLKFPITTEDDVVNWYRDYFKRKPNVKLAVIDHITSPSAIKMPIENLIPLCREFGVLSLIDGAHAPGQIPLNLQQLDADFYTGNLHKWLYAPRGCAILYINKRHQNWVKALVTSHGYKTNFHTDFFHQGTRDDTPYLSVPSAIKFYNDIGGNNVIRDYTDKLLNRATDLLTSEWKTTKLPIPQSMEAPYMRMVQLPTDITAFKGLSSFDELQTLIIDHIVKHGMSCQYTFIDGNTYVRLSANVYNTEKDYRKLCHFILECK